MNKLFATSIGCVFLTVVVVVVDAFETGETMTFGSFVILAGVMFLWFEKVMELTD